VTARMPGTLLARMATPSPVPHQQGAIGMTGGTRRAAWTAMCR
jgi:hypothetical protein